MERTKKQTGRHIMMAMACALSLLSASCSSNNDEPTPNPVNPDVTYKGNVAYSAGTVSYTHLTLPTI